MSATVLRHRYQRLLALYPSEWRAANQTVVLDTLLEAAGPDQRWPSRHETLALLVGGVRVWIGRPRPDAGERGRRGLDGLYLGAILLAVWSLAPSLGLLVSWVGHGFHDVSAYGPVHGGSAASDSVVVLAAVALGSLLRGRARVALVAVGVWVLAGVLWGIIRYPEGTVVGGLAIGPATVVVAPLPLLSVLALLALLAVLAVLAVLVWRRGARSRS